MKIIRIQRAAVALLIVLVAPFASADLLRGRVVGVVDGDTVDVLTSSNEQVRVRVAGIDAPEKRQPYGMAAKHRMSDLVMGKAVSVDYAKQDRYKRTVGVVVVGRVDAGLELVRAGFAWHYKKYQNEQSAADRETYAAAEDGAKARRLGLWGGAEPVPPWEWRKQ